MSKIIYIVLIVFNLLEFSSANPDDKHVQILRLFDAYNISAITATSALEQKKINDSAFRLWAIPITDNKGYVLIGDKKIPDKIRLFEFDKKKLEEIDVNKENVPEWLDALTQNPIEFPKDKRPSATIQHIFIYEVTRQDTRYEWAVREISGDDKSDYGKIIDLIEKLSKKPVDLGWIVAVPYTKD